MKNNNDLVKILLNSDATDLKNEAGRQMLTQKPSNYELVNILKYLERRDFESQKIIDLAAAELRKSVGINEIVDEGALIKEIAEVVMKNPASLKMLDWHCGTSHCIGGYACILNPIAKEVEVRFGTLIAAAAVLPNYVPLFFKDNEEALDVLKSVLK